MPRIWKPLKWHNKTSVIEKVKKYGGNLQYAANELIDDYEVVLHAVYNAPWSIRFASDRLKLGSLQRETDSLILAYTVEWFTYVGTFVCAVQFHPIDLTLRPRKRVRKRQEVSTRCLLGTLNMGNETRSIFLKMIASYAGVRCEACCGYPWRKVRYLHNLYPFLQSSHHRWAFLYR